MMIRVFTTGQVARIFSVNINTVIKWFDEGKLNGFRLPRSNERRIYRESVLSFMEAHEISVDLLRVFDEEQSTRKRARSTRSSEKRGPEQRTFPRKSVKLSAQMVQSDGTNDEVLVRNLSMGGVYVTGLMGDRQSIPIEFQLIVKRDDGEILKGTCQVVHLRRDGDKMALGCRFTLVDPGSLQSYMKSV